MHVVGGEREKNEEIKYSNTHKRTQFKICKKWKRDWQTINKKIDHNKPHVHVYIHAHLLLS